jgi:two-component system chemotaxis response regulator CheY
MAKLRVLIAEEESVSSTLLKSSLHYWGCEVGAVADGAQACQALQSGNFDLCILDWDTPKVSGLELCQWIRFADLKSQPHVILLTSKHDSERILSAYRAGANDFLTKPYRLEDLRTRVSILAQKISRVENMHREVSRMDPLECYRLDLAFHTKALSRL